MWCQALDVPRHCRSLCTVDEVLQIWTFWVLCKVYSAVNRGIRIPDLCHCSQLVFPMGTDTCLANTGGCGRSVKLDRTLGCHAEAVVVPGGRVGCCCSSGAAEME